MKDKIPTLAICYGHQLSYRAAKRYRFAELGEYEAEVYKGNQRLVGLGPDQHIYRNSYYVRPEGAIFSPFGYGETVRKNPAGQRFVAARDWTATYRSVQYHPEFERSTPEDFEWLFDQTYSPEVCVAEGSGLQPGFKRTSTVNIVQPQSLETAQNVERAAFRQWMKAPAEFTPFNRHIALQRILIATPETALRMGFTGPNTLITGEVKTMGRKKVLLLAPDNDIFDIPADISYPVKTVVCLASTHRDAEGVLYGVWNKFPHKTRLVRAETRPLKGLPEVAVQALPPAAVVVGFTKSDLKNYLPPSQGATPASYLEEIREYAANYNIKRIQVLPVGNINDELYTALNLSSFRNMLEWFKMPEEVAVVGEDIVRLDGDLSFDRAQGTAYLSELDSKLGRRGAMTAIGLAINWKLQQCDDHGLARNTGYAAFLDKVPVMERAIELENSAGERVVGIVTTRGRFAEEAAAYGLAVGCDVTDAKLEAIATELVNKVEEVLEPQKIRAKSGIKIKDEIATWPLEPELPHCPAPVVEYEDEVVLPSTSDK